MELKQITENAESIEKPHTTQENTTEKQAEHIQEDKDSELLDFIDEQQPEQEQPEQPEQPEGYTNKNIDYFKQGDFNIKQDNSTMKDFIQKPTTSPTINDNTINYKEDDEIQYIDDEELEKEEQEQDETNDKKEDAPTGLKEVTEQKEKEEKEKKERIKYEVSEDDLKFFCYLFVTGLDWLVNKGMRMAGYEVETSEDQRGRLISVYSKSLAYYNIKLTPVWAMVIITVLIYGGACLRAKKIEEKEETPPIKKADKKPQAKKTKDEKPKDEKPEKEIILKVEKNEDDEIKIEPENDDDYKNGVAGII